LTVADFEEINKIVCSMYGDQLKVLIRDQRLKPEFMLILAATIFSKASRANLPEKLNEIDFE